MLGKDKRICPVCGKHLRLKAPPEHTERADCVVRYTSSGKKYFLRAAPSFKPYTVYPRKNAKPYMPYRAGYVPDEMKISGMKRLLKSDGLSIFNPYLVFFCEECDARLSLNFNPMITTELLICLFIPLVIPLLIALLYPVLFKALWLSIAMTVYGLFLLAVLGCLFYVKRFLSNFVPVDIDDALIVPQCELTLSREGAKKAYLRESNVFCAELSGTRFYIYLAEKTSGELKFSICGNRSEKEKILLLIENTDYAELSLGFEGKVVGKAAVLAVNRAVEEK